MAVVLLRLRLAIARRARGTSNAAQLYVATAWVLGGVGGLLVGTGSAALLAGDGYGDLLLLAGFCSIFLPWVVGPIVEPTLADGVVDPARLEQFPLTAGQQVRGLLAGALVSPTATFTFLFAAGGVVAPGEPVPVRVVSLVTAVAFTVMCVALSRSAQALLAGALRSRRGSDVAAFAAALLVLALYLFAQEAKGAAVSLGGQPVTGPLGAALAWTPPGAAGQALVSARDGNWPDVVLRLAILAVTIAAALGAWAWVLGRRVDGSVGTQHRTPAARRRPVLPLTPPVLAGLPAGPTLAAASQQLRYYFLRSPRAIQTVVIPPVMGVVVAHSSFAGYGPQAQTAAFAALSVVSGAFNLFGYDGRGFGYLVLGGAPLRRVLLGKALAPLLFLLPMVGGFAVVEALARGQVGPELFTALLAGACVVVLGVGVGSAASVLNPSDQSRVGQRQGSFLKVFAWFMGFFALVGIGGGAWWLLAAPLGHLGAGLVMLATTAVAARVLLRWSGRRLEADPYRVLERLAPRAG